MLEEVQDVQAWLKTARLSKYFDAFTELGVETIDDLKEVLKDDLEPLGMKKLTSLLLLDSCGLGLH